MWKPQADFHIVLFIYQQILWPVDVLSSESEAGTDVVRGILRFWIQIAGTEVAEITESFAAGEWLSIVWHLSIRRIEFPCFPCFPWDIINRFDKREGSGKSLTIVEADMFVKRMWIIWIILATDNNSLFLAVIIHIIHISFIRNVLVWWCKDKKKLRITNYENFGENQIIKERNNHNLRKKRHSPDPGESILSDKSCEGHAASRSKCSKKGGECGDNHLHRQLNQSLVFHRKLISFSWLRIIIVSWLESNPSPP